MGLRFSSVDGVWTSWSSWGSCTVTCDGGSQDKTRTCTNPAAQYGGADCVGVGSASQQCNTQACISKFCDNVIGFFNTFVYMFP